MPCLLPGVQTGRGHSLITITELAGDNSGKADEPEDLSPEGSND